MGQHGFDVSVTLMCKPLMPSNYQFIIIQGPEIWDHCLVNRKWYKIINSYCSESFLSCLFLGLFWLWMPNLVQDLYMKIMCNFISACHVRKKHYNVARLVWNIGIFGRHSNILHTPWSEMVGENDFIHHYSFSIQRKYGRLIFQSTDFDCTGHPESGKRLGKSGCVDPSAQVNTVSIK